MRNNFKKYFLEIIVFLSGITAQFSIYQLHWVFSYSLVVYSIFILVRLILKRNFIFDKFLLYWVIYFICWIIISSFYSSYQNIIYSKLMILIFFFVVIFALYNEIKGVNSILITIYYISLLLSFSIIIEFIIKGCILFYKNGVLVRYTGLYSGPNAVGYVIAVGISVFLYLWINNKRSYFPFFILFPALLLTSSRSSYLFVCIFSISFFIKKLIHKKKNFCIITLSTIPIIFFISIKMNLLMSLFRVNDGVSGRDQLWVRGLEIIRNKKIFGCGYGALSEEMHKLAGAGLCKTNTYSMAITGNTHNLYLSITAQLGYIGLFLFLILILYIISNLYKKNKLLKEQNSYNIFKFLICVILAFLGRSFFESNGILSAWVGMDIYMWIFIILALRLKDSGKLETDFKT